MPVQDGEISARLPPASPLHSKTSLSVAGRDRRLVQPPTPAQQDQIGESSTTLQLTDCGGQPPSRCCLRTSQLIQGDGQDRPGAGINRRRFGSISRQMNSMKKGSYR